ncbi:MAG: PH domain-containing protein, partial [bacterium]
LLRRHSREKREVQPMVHASARPRRSLGPVAFQPPRALGVIVGGAFAAWALVIAVLAIRAALGGDAEFKTFLAIGVAGVSLVAGALFANWAYALHSLSYEIDNESLTIRWGFRRVLVPISTIQRMIPGRTLDVANVKGLNWWGCHVGGAEVKRIGYTLFYSTHSTPDELLYLVTTGSAFALTVLDQAAFAEEIQARADLAAVQGDWIQRSTASGLASLPFWRDRVSMLVVVIGAALSSILGGYVYANYPGLPKVVELSFPALGGVVRVGDKSELLRIAFLGAGVLGFNAVAGVALHARERAAGLWLFAGSSIIQVVLLGAAVLAFAKA